MKHEENQLDIFRDDPAVQARAHRIAAQTALSQGDNQFFTAQERHDNYITGSIRTPARCPIRSK